nr:endogenous retrovirus group K member 5 Gag polyprotein-like [Chlorocebus sabaeus]
MLCFAAIAGEPLGPCTFPISVRADPNKPQQVIHEHTPLEFKLLKELKASVVNNSVQSPFTLRLLESVFAAMRLLPFDVKHLVRTCLSASAYLTWNLNWQEMCADQARQNHAARNGDVTEDMLLGNGPYSDLECQMALPDATYQQCAQAAKCAWATIPEEGVPVQSFLHIMQGSLEPYVQFLARLQEAVKRQIPHTVAAEMLTLAPAFENANANCKCVMAPVRCTKNLGNFLSLSGCRN